MLANSGSYVAELEKKVEELTWKIRDTEAKTSAPILPAETPCSMRNASMPREAAKISETREGSTEIVQKINELNHISSIESHASTSPAAIIAHLKKESEPKDQEPRSETTHPSLSASCAAGPVQKLSIEQQNYYFDQAHVFMNGYFESIHFIHPFVDKEDFFSRANDLWFNRSRTPQPSFVALYLSVLSLGSLVRVWEEGTIAGLGRFEWSRKLFAEAQVYLNGLQFSNDLETAQCLYMMRPTCILASQYGHVFLLALIERFRVQETRNGLAGYQGLGGKSKVCVSI
ncbi:unnamed protein product [Penicillium glandicola]